MESLTHFNTTCITQVASTIDTLLGLPGHEGMAEPIDAVLEEAHKKFKEPCDRVFMYNPDAIAEWVYDKHPAIFKEIKENVDLNLEMLSVYPPKTPVCFASMYSGLMPAVHGIQKYEKPVLTCGTIFDDAIKAGKKIAIVSTENDSISLIFLNRPMDYYIYKTIKECNQKALELIKNDYYDAIILYNGDYDHYMHRVGPEGARALRALKDNTKEYLVLKEAIEEHWSGHNTVLGFCPDHGNHRWLGLLGQHGKNEPCDMNIRHFWSFINRK